MTNQALQPSNPILNFVEDKYVKIYPYRFTGLRDDKVSFAANSAMIIAISDIFPQTSKEEAYEWKKDKDGHIYFEVILQGDIREMMAQDASTDLYGEKIYNIESFVAITDQFPPYIERKKLLFTLNKPLILQEYKDNKQTVYIGTNIMPIKKAKEYMYEDYDTNMSKGGYYHIELLNFDVYTQSFTNGSFQFYFNESGVINNPTVVNPAGKTVPGVAVTFEQDALLGSITGKGYNDKLEDTLFFETQEKVAPVKAYPQSVDNNVTMNFPWFHIDQVVPWIDAQVLFDKGSPKPMNIKDMIQAMTKETPLSPLHTDMSDLINGMIGLTQLYNTNFTEVARTTTGKTVGEIDPKATYNSGPFTSNILAMQRQQMHHANDILYQQFITKNPSLSNDDLKLLRRLINGFSMYIGSSYSVAGGANDMVKAVLPWYFVASSAITTSTAALETKPGTYEFYIQSQWLDKHTLLPNKDYDISKDIKIDAGIDVVIPNIPYMLNGEENGGLPISNMAQNKDALNYMWWMPEMTDDSWKKLMLNNHKKSVGWKDYTFDLPTKEPDGEFKTDAQWLDEIYKYIAKVYKVTDKSKIQIKNNGVRVTGVSSGFRAHYDSTTWTSKFKNYYYLNAKCNAYTLLFHHGLPKLEWMIKKGWSPKQIQDKLAEYTVQNSAKYADIMMYGPELAFFVNGRWQVFPRNAPLPYQYTGYPPSDPNPGQQGPFPVQAHKIDVNISYVTEGRNGITVSIEDAQFVDDDRPILYDKQDWTQLLVDLNIMTGEYFTMNMYSKKAKEISRLDELNIGLLWSDKIKIDAGPYHFDIDCINKQDESIVLQKVIFT